MIRKILIANRGEIALRIKRTADELGIATVRVYTSHDTSHDGKCEREALPIPSYLDIAAIVEAARQSRADAIHSGYGFLAENPDFAEACTAAGLIFIGPTPEVIRKMALKDAAREIAIAAGVPVVASDRVFPLLIKAAAGGGGRGMRIVRAEAEFAAAQESARSEAERAFGNGVLLYERYIEGARHVEVQIIGDHHGNVAHLFERDCSVQRRYQKVIEESPSPAVDPALRAKICDAAVTLARAIGYTNAGTVEFLLAPSGEFFFIEVNTRIQVEHPVTEMVTGLDLIRMQIEVAEGRPLPNLPAAPHGHAIEARLYAERPEHDFMPSTGPLHVWRTPRDLEGIRIDSGVREGDEVGVHYDPMLAKIIAWGEDRERAIRRLQNVLRQIHVGGVETNRDYLLAVLQHPDFAEGRAHTGWALDYHRDSSRDAEHGRSVAAHIAAGHRARLGPLAFYRNNPFREPSIKLEIVGNSYGVPLVPGKAAVIEAGGHFYIDCTEVRRADRFPRPAGAHAHEAASSPMPGVVLRVLVAEGQTVKTGDALVVLEAMKMEQTVRAASGGRIGAVPVKPGQVVAPGEVLVDIEQGEKE